MTLWEMIDSLRLSFLTMTLGQTVLFAWGFTYVYYVLMGLPMLVYWAFFPEKKSRRTYPWKDLQAGTLACVILGLFLAFTFWLIQKGYTEVRQIYAAESWAWQLRQCLFYIALHDLYFYVMHRALHHPALFRRFHSVHHQSFEPNPWSTFSFHPLEAILTSAFLPLFVLFIPISPLCFVIFMSLTGLFNTIGHNGFEFFPQFWRRSWLGQILNNYTNHACHHRYVTERYGLYTTVWDRIFGTFHVRATQTIAAHTKLWNDGRSNLMREQIHGSTTIAATADLNFESTRDEPRAREHLR